MGNFKKRLAKSQENWEAAKDRGRSEWEDGLYKFQVQNAEVVESQSSNRLQVHVEHLCLEGDMGGETYQQYLQLESEWGPTFVMQMVERLGHEAPENFEDIEEVIDAIAEAAPVYMAKIATNQKGYQNLNVTRLLEAEGEKPAVDDDAAEEEEDEDAAEEEEAEEEEEEEEEEEDDDDDEEDEEEEEDEDEDEDEDEEDEEEEEDPGLAELTALAQTLEVSVTDKDTVKSLTKKICGYEYDRSELMEDEIELLEKLGAKLTEPTPKKAAPKKKGKGKPATKKGSGKGKGKGKGKAKGKAKGKGKKKGKR